MVHDGSVPERWIALLDAIDRNTKALYSGAETHRNMVDGLHRICEAITKLTDILENK